MAFTQFPSVLYLKVSETDETFMAAGFSPGHSQQLLNVVMTLYNHGAYSADRFRVKLYHDAALTKLYATSNWLNLSAISGISSDWLGRVRFDFDPATMPWLNSSYVYYLSVEASNYTRNADTRYACWMLDWPLSVNVQSSAPSYGCHFELYGYRYIRQ